MILAWTPEGAEGTITAFDGQRSEACEEGAKKAEEGHQQG